MPAGQRAASSYRGVFLQNKGGSLCHANCFWRLCLLRGSHTPVFYIIYLQDGAIAIISSFPALLSLDISVLSVGGGGGYMQHNVFLYTKVGRHMCVWANSKNTCQHPMMGLMSEF